MEKKKPVKYFVSYVFSRGDGGHGFSSCMIARDNEIKDIVDIDEIQDLIVREMKVSDAIILNYQIVK